MTQEAIRITGPRASGFPLRPLLTALRLARAKPVGAGSAVVLVLIWILVLAAPLLTPYQWDQLYTGDKLGAPTLAGRHFFGMDNSGRDVFTRVLYGGRLTLSTSIIATTGAVFLAALFAWVGIKLRLFGDLP